MECRFDLDWRDSYKSWSLNAFSLHFETSSCKMSDLNILYARFAHQIQNEDACINLIALYFLIKDNIVIFVSNNQAHLSYVTLYYHIYRITQLLQGTFFTTEDLRIISKHMQQAIQMATWGKEKNQVFNMCWNVFHCKQWLFFKYNNTNIIEILELHVCHTWLVLFYLCKCSTRLSGSITLY